MTSPQNGLDWVKQETHKAEAGHEVFSCLVNGPIVISGDFPAAILTVLTSPLHGVVWRITPSNVDKIIWKPVASEKSQTLLI